MRLIDADALIEVATSNDIYGMVDIDIISRQPTAYDVDKVIEQLEDERFTLLYDTEYPSEVINYFLDWYDSAIEIVKERRCGMTAKEVLEFRHGKDDLQKIDVKEVQKVIDEALEKQIPKKPYRKNYIGVGFTSHCPKCGSGLDELRDGYYCHDCGQKLDWSEEE